MFCPFFYFTFKSSLVQSEENIVLPAVGISRMHVLQLGANPTHECAAVFMYVYKTGSEINLSRSFFFTLSSTPLRKNAHPTNSWRTCLVSSASDDGQLTKYSIIEYFIVTIIFEIFWKFEKNSKNLSYIYLSYTFKLLTSISSIYYSKSHIIACGLDRNCFKF